jgi:hypothetical protein
MSGPVDGFSSEPVFPLRDFTDTEAAEYDRLKARRARDLRLMKFSRTSWRQFMIIEEVLIAFEKAERQEAEAVKDKPPIESR